MSNATVRGRFLWHELLTTDTRAATAFYTKVVGWTTQAWERDPSYTMWMAKTGPMGGVMTLPADAKMMGAPPNWLTYIGTPDVDATVRDATRLGGRLLTGPMEIPTVGRFAVLADPQGAVFAAFTPAQAPSGEGGPPKPGDFSWHELVTTDHMAAFRFYRELFGWEKTQAMDMGPEMGTYQMYGWQGVRLGGMYNKPKEMPAPPHWLPYAMVPDAKKAAAAAKASGGTVVNGPMEVPGGDWITQIIDPQGAAFAVHSAKPAAPARRPAVKKPKAAKKPARKRKAEKKARKGRATGSAGARKRKRR